MKQTPLVSILMPVFNREGMVPDAIRSIQNQTFKDWELIILDDGSYDNTLEVCRSFEKKDERIRVYSNGKNLGVGETRNRLLTYVKGEYVANHDSDDISSPQRLEKELTILKEKPEVGIVSGIAAWLDDAGLIYRQFPDLLIRGGQYPQEKSEMVKMLYMGCVVVNPACMFRKEFIQDTPEPYSNYRYMDDWHFLIHMAHKTRMWGIPEVLVTMRRGKKHDHLSEFTLPAQSEALQITKRMYEFYKDNPDSPINYMLYRKSIAPFLTQQGRILCGWKGYLRILQAVSCDPTHKRAWISLWEFSGRAFKKAKGMAVGNR
jgi:glycosyltransferase involved in cell wall biosynthesis